jgi:AraC-like DNA-binding protein
MNTLHSSLYAAALVSCLFLLFAVRAAPAPRRRRAGFLFGLLILLSLNFSAEWLMSNPSSPAKSLWLVMVMGLALLLGPCLWMYARTVTEPAPQRIRDLPAWHFAVIAIGLVLLVPLMTKIHSGSQFQHPDTVLPVHQPSLVHTTMLACIAVFALQAAFYLRASYRLLERQSKAARALFSDLEDRELNSLRVMIFVVGAHWLSGIARALHCLLLGKDAGYVVLFAICEVMFSLWAAASLLRAGVVADPEDRRLAGEIGEIGEVGEVGDVGEVKYARSALDAPARERILRKLAEGWAVHRLHLDSQLSLRALCARLRENPHYVSQVINQDLATSFYDLVNRQRIAAAKEALTRDPERNVLEIAMESGFNSKSTFNLAFRQHAGTTPSDFRRAGNGSRGSLRSDPAG